MSNLSVFRFEGHPIRVVGTEERPLWVAADACKILDLDTSTAVNGRPDRPNSGLDEDEKDTALVSTPGGEQEMLVVTEPGLYQLIFKSRKAIAKRFKRWLAHEVVPTIRKTGSYSPTESAPVSRIPLLSPKEELDCIYRMDELLTKFCGGRLEERDRLALADATRNVVHKFTGTAQTQTALPAAQEITISERAMQLGYRVNSGQLKSIGRRVSTLYQAKHGEKASERRQWVDGAPRSVKSYTSADLDIIDAAIRDSLSK